MRDQWLAHLTDDQRELRKQNRYDEIRITEEQRELIGEAGCCWIESPQLMACRSPHVCPDTIPPSKQRSKLTGD